MYYKRFMNIVLAVGLLCLATPSLIFGQQMYFTNSSSNTIERANLDGTDVQTLLTSNRPVAIAVDLAGGKMY